MHTNHLGSIADAPPDAPRKVVDGNNLQKWIATDQNKCARRFAILREPRTRHMIGPRTWMKPGNRSAANNDSCAKDTAHFQPGNRTDEW